MLISAQRNRARRQKVRLSENYKCGFLHNNGVRIPHQRERDLRNISKVLTGTYPEQKAVSDDPVHRVCDGERSKYRKGF
ncbi:hypothetical protein GCM10010946_11950 [Undibacterium squillarum]|uniref:Uncharacterized protein n=1 Tax=Undibacterium squillarum TaxID=1131567 RepID=A0ABQ2XVU5_9BURK|nr:hypothetical protein GCM10010946_11950 [Undibacterium squillarum]